VKVHEEQQKDHRPRVSVVARKGRVPIAVRKNINVAEAKIVAVVV